MYVGVELEIESVENYQRILNLLPDVKALAHRPITEQDGSLMYNSGVEIVFPPVKPSTLTSKNSVFGKAIAALAPVGTQRNTVGMHLNVNTNGWTTAKRAVFITVVNWIPRAALERLGGRELNGYCEQGRHESGLYDVDYRSVLDCYNNAHSYAAETRGVRRIELRFPGSTTDRKRIAQLMNFITLLDAFCDLATEQPATTPVAYVKAFGIFLSGSKKGRSLRKYMGVPSVSPNLNSTTTTLF